MTSILHRRYATFFAAAGSALAALPVCLWLAPQATVQICANILFLVYLLLEVLKLPRLTAAFLKHNAANEDEPTWLIVAVTFMAVVVSVGSLFIVLNSGGQPEWWELSLSLASVALGWLTIHTMAAHHYAYLYWRPGPDRGSGAEAKKAEPRRGLDFPGDDEPGGYDFLYFSLVVGMTAQTSDVAVTKTQIRKLNMLHAVVSFFFNTVLVAAAVNVAVSLGN
jgi:uncharacterized membrane protein